jgi:hypothetical protein
VPASFLSQDVLHRFCSKFVKRSFDQEIHSSALDEEQFDDRILQKGLAEEASMQPSKPQEKKRMGYCSIDEGIETRVYCLRT